MAKKKIKDFTIGEIMDICNKYCQNRCRNCPFENCCVIPADMEEESLEEEIEVEKDKPQKCKDLRGCC